MDFRKVNFDRELDRGRQAYEGGVGSWWQTQASNHSHQRAYRTIVSHLEQALPRPPRVVVDYACGSGHILTRLARRFPSARVIGYDGSAALLERARERLVRLGKDLSSRVELSETVLPNFTLPTGFADAVVFAFPNIVNSERDERLFRRHRKAHPGDVAAARYLAEAREPDPEDETVTEDADTLFDHLIDDKVISRNVRGLLKKGGLCARAEYSNAPRHEFTRLVQERKAFEEGSLKGRFSGKAPAVIFRYLECSYRRSRVIEDVYHQTGDEDDNEGGYTITLLEAV